MRLFRAMSKVELRSWVEANPDRINDKDEEGFTPLFRAAQGGLPLVLWLLNEKGADVNAKAYCGNTALFSAASLEVLNALLDRGADPIALSNHGTTPLMHYVSGRRRYGMVNRLLQDPRVRATSDMQDQNGNTALHYACLSTTESCAGEIPNLLPAGANSALTNNQGKTPLASIRLVRPRRWAAIRYLEQAPDAEKTWVLVKARRLVITAASSTTPSYLQGRVTRGEPLPCVELMPVESSHTEGADEEDRKLRTTLAFVVGMEGGFTAYGMPRDVFRVVLDLLMPSWDPLRKRRGSGQQLQA